ncbi:MAG: PilZ domain-containing protein [Acidobacteriaceae bacterium]|nr:PilZ domain-containing protein [Acidobacteriaceae bacterium]
MIATDKTSNEPVRASVRFPLHLAVTLHTEERDYEATTVDVSANGVLFAGMDLPPVDTRVTFRMTMPAAVMGGREDVVVHCVGRIVRHSKDDGNETAAAVIDEYSLKAEHV